MNGDILDRLQMAILVCDHGAPNGGGPMGPDPNPKECSECNFFRDAADEISQLRKQNKWLASRIGALKIETRDIRNKEDQK